MRFSALALSQQICYSKNMETTIDIQTIATSRLKDLVSQVQYLYEKGRVEDAEFLRNEGLHLAMTLDSGSEIMYLPDFSR